MSSEPSSRDESLLESILNRSGDTMLRLFGARGILPLTPEDRLRVFLATRTDPVPEIAREAQSSLERVSPDDWLHFLAVASVTTEQLDALASISRDSAVLEEVVRNRDTSDATLTRLAREAEGTVQEALVVNQARLLKSPEIIEVLLANPGLTADSRRRLLETLEEFFEKQARRDSVAAAEEALAAEAAEVSTEETADTGEPAEEAGAAEEPEADEASGDLFQKLTYMTVSEKIQTALKGTREERRILIRDVSKIVVDSVLRCPKLNEAEVASFAGMRNIDEEVFRKIAATREWVKKYSIIQALVRNPKVPPDVSLGLVKFLRTKDLKLAAGDRDLSEAVRVSARKFYRLKLGS